MGGEGLRHVAEALGEEERPDEQEEEDEDEEMAGATSDEARSVPVEVTKVLGLLIRSYPEVPLVLSILLPGELGTRLHGRLDHCSDLPGWKVLTLVHPRALTRVLTLTADCPQQVE